MIEPGTTYKLPTGRPVLGIRYEHCTGQKYVLYQRYGRDMTFEIHCTPHHQATVERQYQRRRKNIKRRASYCTQRTGTLQYYIEMSDTSTLSVSTFCHPGKATCLPHIRDSK